MVNNRFEEIHSQTRLLHELALSFAPDSPEYIALENASFALIFAATEQWENFTQFVQSNSEELSSEQKEHLRQLGIPDA
jgi:hypothetical protein